MAKPKLPPVFPDFILIGAPDAGGDLVKLALQQHPQIWFPPLDNILAFHPSFQLARLQTLRKMLARRLAFKPAQLVWYLTFFLSPGPSLRWYSRLLRTKDETLLKGELSDEYLTQPLDEVERMQRLMPKTKIILMIRNPVERSHAALREKFRDNRKTPFDSLSPKQLLSLMNSDWARTHSSYQRALDNWTVFFPRSKIFIGFYDDLIASPVEFIDRVQQFLHIDAPVPDHVADLIPPQDQGFPEEYLKYLHPFYRQEVEGLANRLSGHAGRWFDKFPVPVKKAFTRRRISEPPKPKSPARVTE